MVETHVRVRVRVRVRVHVVDDDDDDTALDNLNQFFVKFALIINSINNIIDNM